MGRSSDFKFWGEKLPVHSRSCGDEGEFFEEQRHGDDQVGEYSPPLWGRSRVNLRPENSALLPQNHQYSCLSPAARVRAIIDGRRELMEMIKDLPESSYELYLLARRRGLARENSQEYAQESHPRDLVHGLSFSEQKYKSRKQRGCLF